MNEFIKNQEVTTKLNSNDLFEHKKLTWISPSFILIPVEVHSGFAGSNDGAGGSSTHS